MNSISNNCRYSPSFGAFQKPSEKTMDYLEKILTQASPEIRDEYVRTVEQVVKEQKDNPYDIKQELDTKGSKRNLYMSCSLCNSKGGWGRWDGTSFTIIGEKDDLFGGLPADYLVESFTRDLKYTSDCATVAYKNRHEKETTSERIRKTLNDIWG